MSIWAARDKSGNLFFYNRKPEKGKEVWFNHEGEVWHFDNKILPEITWEDAKPFLVEFTIKRNNMENKENNIESLRMKLAKLQALADRGVDGEADNAKRLIQKLCSDNGITIEDILSEQKKEYRFKIGQEEMFLRLFTNCYAKITNLGQLKYWQSSRSEIIVELTPVQYVDLKCLFEWHKENLLKDLKVMKEDFLEAYVHKHRLFSNRKQEDKSGPLSTDELSRLRRIFNLQKNLNDNNYHKMLEYGTDNEQD